MAEKKIKRVISRVASIKETKETVSSSKEDRPAEEKAEETGRPKRACLFCKSKTTPSYTDTVILRRFVTDRAKIVPKLKSNLCSKHQRTVTKQIKYARHLSLLPFTPKI